MKNLLTILILTLSFIGIVNGQTPQAFKYQAVARDLSGNVLTDRNVSFRISILQTSSSGTAVYSEKHNRTTNTFGLVDLEIGNGTAPTGSFAAIDWASNLYFLKVEMDPNGGSSYQLMGTSQLLSVPYSLQSKKADEVADNSVTSAKIAGNAVTVAKLPTGATATSYLRGDGTWQIPPSSSPAGNDGSIQYNYRGNFTYSQYLHWDYVNSRLGIGTNTPDSKVQIYTTSSPTYPQLKLYESNSSGYARLNFQNSSGSSFWSLSALNSATNANERFNLYNSTSGTVLSFSGEGHAGMGTDPYTTVKFFVKDNGNVYSGVFENNGSYNTLQARNFGSGSAGNFISNGTTYTLYAQNLGTGPAAYFDGTLQVAGGNTAEINRNQTGSANIVPICYGSVELDGTKNSGGSTANFTVTKIATGVYDVTISGDTYSQSTHCAITSLGDVGFINSNAVSGKLRIYTFTTSYVSADREFSFVVYKP